jgi:hypothetical protein
VATTDFSTDVLIQALNRASDDVKREVSTIVDATAHAVVSRVQSRYPVGPTGNLRSRVFVTSPRAFATTSTGQTIPARRVRATAPHVHIWQEGTRERVDATRGNARRGRMPKGGRVFEATAADARRDMYRQMQSLLERNKEIA